jgi:general secretion pathway protein L
MLANLQIMLRAALVRITALLHWWGAALTACVPQPVLAWAHGLRPRLVICASREQIVLQRQSRRTSETIFELPTTGLMPSPPPGIAAVRLADDLVFRRRITLPRAAEANLATIIRNEIDRQTPLAADDVYFDFRIVDRDAKARTIAVEVAVAKRGTVDRVLTLAQSVRLTPHEVGLAADNDARRFNLLRSEQPARLSAHGWINLGIVGAGAVAIAVLVQAALVDLDAQVEAAQHETATARAAFMRSDTARREIAQLAAQTGYLARRKQGASPLRVIEELTERLPDSAWVSYLYLASGEVRISGYAADTAGLIATLEQSRVLQTPRFRAAVTRSGSADIDRFELSVDIRAGGQP